MRKIVALILALTMVAGMSMMVHAEPAQDATVLKMAISNADTYLMNTFAEKLEAATNGAYTVEMIDMSSLNGSADALAMCKNGTIDFYFNSAAQTPADFPASDVVQIPFFIGSPEKVEAVEWGLYEAGLYEEYDEDIVPLIFAATDAQLLSFANKKVETIDDFKGLKMRAASGITVDMLKAFGSEVVTMGFGEVYESLRQGIIDGVQTSPVMMAPNSMYEVLKYTMDYPVFYGSLILVMNLDRFESLDEEIQEAFRTACAEQEAEVMANVQANFEKNVATLIEGGDELYVPGDELVDAMKAFTPDLIQIYINNVKAAGIDGEAIIEKVQEIIAE